jgi:hypothetical protein
MPSATIAMPLPNRSSSAPCYCVAFGPDGWSEYVGYVWAATPGKARMLAAQTDPGDAAEFVDIRIRRRPDLDGLEAAGAAWWCPADVPASFIPRAFSILWNLSDDCDW